MQLNRLLKRGIELYHCQGLHAKVMLFDNVAVVGSANISQSSQND
jgi:phosphatidylserine/phosphatidylglycerophosphate/cardiolipin synthase-like enzyme